MKLYKTYVFQGEAYKGEKHNLYEFDTEAEAMQYYNACSKRGTNRSAFMSSGKYYIAELDSTKQ